MDRRAASTNTSRSITTSRRHAGIQHLPLRSDHGRVSISPEALYWSVPTRRIRRRAPERRSHTGDNSLAAGQTIELKNPQARSRASSRTGAQWIAGKVYELVARLDEVPPRGSTTHCTCAVPAPHQSGDQFIDLAGFLGHQFDLDALDRALRILQFNRSWHGRANCHPLCDLRLGRAAGVFVVSGRSNTALPD